MRESESSAGACPLRYARPPDLGPSCRPIPRVDVLNQDQRIGEFDGLPLSAMSDSPLYLVLQRGDGQRRVIRAAWFDQGTEVIRVHDEDVQSVSFLDLGASG